ncbi:MAG TPA: hypothetical protein VJ836_00970 [Candidatus Saccharimonadales bacterium]|nr:hypothetical protein [Candidatus Saccharimonadales bacterium]
MTLALLILAGGLAVIGLVLLARWLDARAWAASLRVYRLHLPANLTADDVARWLSNVSAITHPPLWSLLPMPPVSLEITATSNGITHYILVMETVKEKMLSGVRAALPGVRIEEAPEYLTQRPVFRVAAEAAITSDKRPLAAERAVGANAALLAAMQPVPPGCEVRLAWTFTSAGTPQPVPTRPADSDWMPFLLESEAPADADAVRALRLKHSQPLLRAVARLGVAAPNKGQAFKLFGRVWPVLHSANAPGVRVVRRWLPSGLVAERMIARRLPVTQWPVVVNAQELTALLAVPIGGVQLPGLSLGAARQLPPVPHMASRGAVIGVSNYPGMNGRTVALKADDQLRHQYIVGPTGSGKSVLINRLVVQRFGQGYGGAVFDPKGDLVADILARLPNDRLDDVIVLDAHDRLRPVGFNLLGNVHNEVDRELTVDNVLHIFRSIWADFWGPRSDAILRASLNTLSLARAGDDSAFTICELPALLSNANFRASVISRATLPDSLRDYWARFNALSEAEQVQSVSPLLNKLDAFVQRVPINLMLGQSTGIDMRSIFQERKLLLVNLAKGALGSETANLLGSLLVASLWQATTNRVHVPPAQRRPVFAFIDECQDLVRLPIPLPEILSQARGLGLSITLANQYFSQLPTHIQAAVLGTVRTTLSFAVDYDDAKLLERRFAPLTADDLTGLARYELAARCCVDGQTLTPCTLTALPPDPPLRNPDGLAALSRDRYGLPRHEVEAAMRQRLQADALDGNDFGRVRHRGGL